MKHIRILRSNGTEVHLYDDDKKEVRQYVEELTELFKVPNIVTIESSTGESLTIRPKRVDGFIVTDEDIEFSIDAGLLGTDGTNEDEEIQIHEDRDIHSDIIRDGD